MNQNRGIAVVYFCAGLGFCAFDSGSAGAGGAERWEFSGRDAFLAGQLEGAAVTGEGQVVLAPAKEQWAGLEATSIWALALAPDGSLFAGTGNDGKVFRITRGKAEVYFDADELEVHALAIGPDGALYAGTSPGGKVYRLTGASQASVFFDPADSYIWALRFASDGSLYVGTGPDGKLYQVDRSGKGSLFYDSEDAHIRVLAFDQAGKLLAGTSGSGWVIRFDGERPFVLMDADQPEVTGLTLGPDGSIYASLIGAAAAKKSEPQKTTATPAAFTATVVASVDVGEPAGPTASQPTGPPVAAPGATVITQGGALIRIHPDGFGETLWSDSGSSAYAAGYFGGQAVVGTGDKGRLLGIDERGRSGALFDANAKQLSSLLPLPNGTLAAASSNPAKVFVLGPEAASSGSYLSEVQDAETFAQWGSVEVRSSGGTVTLRTRSGNTQEPGNGWSAWSEARGKVSSPAARFFQFRLDLAGQRPAVQEVVISYQPRNLQPKVEAIDVLPANQALDKQQIISAGTTFAIGSDLGQNAGQKQRAEQREKGYVQQTVKVGMRSLRWQTSDPNGDELRYAVYFRGVGEQSWKLLKDRLEDEFFAFDARLLPDGLYEFQVVADDSQDNPPERAKTGELVTPAILVDNSPPTVTLQADPAQPSTLSARASDTVSVLKSAAYGIDAGLWIPILPQDGVMDDREESFRITLPQLEAGEHLLVLRVEDDAENIGTGRLVITR